MNHQQSTINNPTWRFIVNPKAGNGKVARRWNYLEKKLMEAGVLFEAVFTERKFHAAELAAQAIAEGCRHLAAVGGDGTAHEVVNGIFNQSVCLPEEVTFALLPVGTGNDWIKTHRIPKNFRRWLRMFQKGNTTLQDVGWVTYFREGEPQKRWFINVAGLSYDAFVVKESETQPGRISNKLFYLLLIFRCLFRFKIPRARVSFDGRTEEDYFYTINAGICRYSGGGMQLVPHAIPDDGLLALTLARRISKLEVLLVTPLFYTGKIGWHPAVSMYQAKEILVEGLNGDSVLVEADGEFLGHTPVRFGLKKKAMRVVEG